MFHAHHAPYDFFFAMVSGGCNGTPRRVVARRRLRTEGDDVVPSVPSVPGGTPGTENDDNGTGGAPLSS